MTINKSADRFRTTGAPRQQAFTFPLAIWLVGQMILFSLFACQPSQSVTQIWPAQTTPRTNTPDPSIIRLATGEWAPYISKNLEHYGCDAWLVTEAFSSVGLKVEYGFFPWSRAYQQALDGAWDGTFEWANTPEHRDKFYLSADYLSEQEWIFFYRADKPFDWQTLNDLTGKTVGLTSGYVYSNRFVELQRKGNVRFETASSDIANFQRLLAGRIDVFPIESKVGQLILENNFSAEERAQLKAHPKAFDAFQPYLLLTKGVPGNKQRIALFDQGFKQLKASGRYAEIMSTCAP